MFPEPSEQVRELRWNNAVNLTNKFIKFLEDNQYCFMLDDSTILRTDNIHISENTIQVIIEDSNKITSYMIYDNTTSTNTARESTNYWFVENILLNSTLVKVIYNESFIHKYDVDLNDIIH